MDLWSIRIIVKDKFKELFSEYFENFDGYMSSSLFQDNDLNCKYDIDKSYNLSTNKLGEFHLNKYWILEIILNIKPDKKDLWQHFGGIEIETEKNIFDEIDTIDI